MKRFLAKYILFVYVNYIIEDFSDLNIFGKIIIYPFWYIRNIISILFSIICFPIVLLHMYYVNILFPEKIEPFFEKMIKTVEYVMNSK